MIHEALINYSEPGIISVERKVDGQWWVDKEPLVMTEIKDGVVYKYGKYEEIDGMNKEPLLLSVQFDAQRFTSQKAKDYLLSNGIAFKYFDEFIPTAWALSCVQKDRRRKEKFLSIGKNLYKKDVIRTGHFEHPGGDWTLDVDEGKMLGWVNSFNAMQENGVDVEVVVDHSLKADDVRGLVTGLEVEDGELIATLELTEDGEKTIQNVKNVSVCIEPNVKDGSGNVYGEAITHIALVQKPVVSGQRDFVPIAASMVAPLMLSIITPEKEQEDSDMEFKEFISKINTKCNLSLVADDADKCVDAIADAMKPATKPQETTPEPVMEQMASIGEQRLSLLVKEGILSPAAKEKALSLLGKKGERNAMMLSLNSDGKCGINDLCDILEANKPVQPGQMKLSTIDNPNNPADDTATITQQMIAMK